MTRNAVWALSNLCRGKNPPPAFEKVLLCPVKLTQRNYNFKSGLLLFNLEAACVTVNTTWTLNQVQVKACTCQELIHVKPGPTTVVL